MAAFQRSAWANAWVEHLGAESEPLLVLVGDPPLAILPLALRRIGGVRVLGLLGEGVSDLLGTAPLDAPADVYRAIGACLRGFSARWDLLDWKSLAADREQRAALADGLGRRIVARVYEHCPFIETSGTWERYLASRNRSFRKDLKKAERRLHQRGRVSVGREMPSASLFDDFVAVERDSWKWAEGRALLRDPRTRAFLRAVLLDQDVAQEIWTVRVNDSLAGFAVILSQGNRRLYYLSSFRAQFPKAGAFLMAEIIRGCFAGSADRFEFLQGDQSYKLAWCQGEDTVYEIAAAGSSPVGLVALAAVRARWRLARSERLRRWRELAVTRLWQRKGA
ncbi:MAG: GNAT family N-acetyltransferase [Deltaproteobacteria bacterium]|nr:GNAT family N-acetyltransferase [Deltaproteobacteria bacterium]